MTTRVLLVDDVPTERLLVRVALERSGRFEVVGEGSDGAEGVDLAVSLRPDLVLMDLSMPRMDGLEALTHLRARCPGIPVVILSGFSADDAAESALHLGAAGYLEKGLHPSELVAYLSAMAAPAPAPEDAPAAAEPAASTVPQRRVVQTVDPRLLIGREELHGDLLAVVQDAIVLQDVNGTVRSANPAAERVLGIDLGHAGTGTLLDPSWEVIDEHGQPVTGRDMPGRRALHTGEPQLGRVLGIVRPDGSCQWVLVNTVPLVDAADAQNGAPPAPYGVVSSFSDITALRDAQVLRDRLAAVEEHTEDAVATLALDGTVRSWNGAAERLYGFRSDEIVGHDGADLVPPAERPALAGLLAEVRAGGAVRERPARRLRRDGTVVEVVLSVSPLRDATGSLVGCTAISRPVGGAAVLRRSADVEA